MNAFATSPPKAAIVAGGKGTRIRSISGDAIPKALVPLAGEPVVERQLRLLAECQVKEVAIFAGHLADELRCQMTPACEKYGLTPTFFVEEKPLGTAGAFAAARSFFGSDDFLVLYGDMIVEMDLARMMNFHRAHGGCATVVCRPNDHPYESDLVRIDRLQNIIEILPRKNRQPGFYPNLVPASVFVFSPKIFDFLQLDHPQDFTNDILPRILASSAGLRAYYTPEYLRDMGTPERYAAVEKDILDGVVSRSRFEQLRPAIFFDRDGVLNPEPGGQGVIKLDQMQLLDGAAAAIRLVNQAGYLAILTTNQPQLAKGFLSSRELETIFNKLETLLGAERAKLDRIYFCPHHQEKGHEGEVAELKIDCDCRKPKSGMIKQAAMELPIDLGKSCSIGDSARDMVAAHRLGLRAYGVRTGNACQDCLDSSESSPDMIFDDVLSAVTFILKNT